MQEKLSSIFLAKAIPNSISILKLLPGSKYSKEKIPDDFYDFSSIGSLVRDFIELTNQRYYFCLINVSKNEIDFTWSLFNLHQFRESQKIVMCLRDLSETRDLPLERDIITEKSRLMSNTFFLSLPGPKQKALRNGTKFIHMNNQEIIDLRGQNSSIFQGVYKLMSNYTYSSPLSLNHIEASNKLEELPIVGTKLIIDYYNNLLTEFLWSINDKWGIRFRSREHQIFIEDKMAKI